MTVYVMTHYGAVRLLAGAIGVLLIILQVCVIISALRDPYGTRRNR